MGFLRSLFSKRGGSSASSVSVEDLPDDPKLQTALANAVLSDLIKERRSNRRWTWIKRAGFAAFVLVGLIFYISFEAKTGGVQIIPSDPIVAIVRVEGSIMNTTLASAEKIVPALRKAFERKNTVAVVLAIDSPGGAPVEAERINYVLDELKKKHKKPVYAVIQNVGASAAYMIALHADKIIAGRYSMVGSIGAVMSAWDVHKALERYDVQQKVYASGELKAMLNPFIAPTKEAEEKAQSIVNLMGGRFATEMAQLRASKLQPGVKYDTGEIWDGENAKTLGLIDELGTIESIQAKYDDAQTYDFGPGAKNSGLFSSSFSDSVFSKLSMAIRIGVTEAFAPRLE